MSITVVGKQPTATVTSPAGVSVKVDDARTVVVTSPTVGAVTTGGPGIVVATGQAETIIMNSQLGPPGPMGPQGPAGASNAIYSAEYMWSPTAGPVPQAGRIRTNTGNFAGATALLVSDITEPGNDIGVALDKFKVGDHLRVQDADDGANWALFAIAGPSEDQGTWHNVPVTFADGAGSSPKNNAGLLLSLLVSGSTSAQWYTGDGPPPSDLGRPGDMYLEGDGSVWENPEDNPGWVETTTDLTGPQGPQGYPGPPGFGASTFVFNQLTPSSTWVIDHHLGVWPSVTVVDSGGSIMVGDVSYTDENTVVVTFAVPFGGTAYLN